MLHYITHTQKKKVKWIVISSLGTAILVGVCPGGFTSVMNRKQLTAVITQKLQMSGHMVDKETSFKIIITNKNPQFNKFAEATTIRKFYQHLCKQKELTINLKLLWRTANALNGNMIYVFLQFG